MTTKFKLVGRSALRISGAALAFYLLYAGLLFGAQRHMLYPAWGQEQSLHATPDDAEAWWIDTEDGDKVEALFLPSKVPGKRPVVVHFHGNGETIRATLGSVVDGYRRRGFHVLVPEYRGYGTSGGSPSQEGIVSDAARFVDRAAAREDVDPDETIFHGVSLGGGVAASLSRERKPKLLILQSSFTTIRSYAADMLVPAFLVRDPYDTGETLASLDIPVLILHGVHDEVVPLWHSVANERAAQRGARHEFDAGHFVSVPDGERARYWSILDAFLDDEVARAKLK